MTDSVQQPPPSVKPGDVIAGKFRIERVLGEGGMGVVVAAMHIGLEQRVAIKLMLPSALAYPENVARFEREARAAVRLKSEHVAKVSDVGRLESGAPYMVMEYLEGKDLDQVITDSGKVPVTTAVDYVVQAAEAVAEAHALGIVHRDLKPKNLFLTTRLNGTALVKVLDFGISKSAGFDDMSLTSTTQVMGSPNYMSPEQLRSARDVDHRTDIWAFGAILYEMLTGYVPFVATTVTQLTAMVVADQPRPMTELRPDLPAALVGVVMKCLEKQRLDRFSSVAELCDALTPFTSPDGAAKVRDIVRNNGEVPRPSQLPPPERSSIRVLGRASTTESAWDRTQLANGIAPRGRWMLVAAGVATLAVIGVVATFALKRPKDSGAQPTNPPRVIETTLASSALPTRDPVIPPLVTATGGVDHPVPIGIPSSAVIITKKPDAGTIGKRRDSAAGDLLPNVRN